MRLLLDTHALIWWTIDLVRLSPPARAAIADPDNDVYVSAVSAMEITTKHRLGMLPSARRLALAFEAEVAAEGFAGLPISVRHGELAGGMGIQHKDPFDRLLIAQALVEGMTLVSNEALFDAAGASRIW